MADCERKENGKRRVDDIGTRWNLKKISNRICVSPRADIYRLLFIKLCMYKRSKFTPFFLKKKIGGQTLGKKKKKKINTEYLLNHGQIDPIPYSPFPRLSI